MMKDAKKNKVGFVAGNFKFSIHGIREKLITIFIIIKVIPLIALALFAAKQLDYLGNTVKIKSEEMVGDTRALVSQVGEVAVDSSIAALDLKSRENIERLTTDTAKAVASFLYDRDNDVLLAASLPVSKNNYERFLASRVKERIFHAQWVVNEAGTSWISTAADLLSQIEIEARVTDNRKDFHYRVPEKFHKGDVEPLYHQITFIDLEGQEQIKVSGTDLLNKQLVDVSQQKNTWCKAESYFKEIKSLSKGEIFVSKVIGPYLPSPIIGPYTPARAKQLGVPYSPETAGYAGKENPVGKRFQGIIRWVTPVYEGNTKIGYITLALDHSHLMEFTDHLVPTEQRYSDISDAGSGNYAFMWDAEGRNISHTRDYFIVGYDPETGEQAVPWLSEDMYEIWKNVGKSFSDFHAVAPQFKNQSLQQKPASELKKAGMLALDCRYLNFAPQCSGWMNLTQSGGSGSFVILWSNLWKLTTAASIPYFTGPYAKSPRGFGFVTIGANVSEFHSAATETAHQIKGITREYETSLEQTKEETLTLIDAVLSKTIQNLTWSTLIMVILVIFIAVWIASTLTGKITNIIKGLRDFQSGSFSTRLEVDSQNELGELSRAFNEMSDNIQGSVSEIQRARDRAEESDKTKSLFLANMSHEIRTPMSAIIGMNRLALQVCEDPGQKRMLESVRLSADSLLTIINDILDFSKIEADQLDLENHTFSLHKLVESTVKPVAVLAEDKNIDIGFRIGDNVPVLVRGDNMRVRQILNNLLGNAVKFTRKGVISLEVRQGAEQPDDEIEVVFTIRDTGIGIPEGHIETIFERFSQSDVSIARKYQGSGLGLAISRELCRMMGGDISVQSEVGMGSTFEFTLLFQRPGLVEERVDLDNRTEGMSKLTPLDILLVEDNESNRELARLVLEQENHTVALAESGMVALQKLVEARFDIVLMDIQMPVMDGFTATRIIRYCETGQQLNQEISKELEAKLREKLFGKHQPMVALTAHAMRGDKEKCLAAGLDDYLTKPFIPEQVVAALRRHASNSGIHTEEEQNTSHQSSETLGVSLYEQAQNNLISAYGLDREQVEILLQKTVESAGMDIQKLGEDIDERNWDQINRTAHSIKGVLLNLRLQDQAALAAQIQNECENKNHDQVREFYQVLCGELESLLSAS